MPLRPALALAATVLLWGSAFAAIRAALEHFSAAHLSVLRLLVATLALCAIAAARGVRLPARRDLPAIAAVGFAGMTAYQLLLNSGERTVPAGTASLLVNLSPVFTALGASLWLGEDMTRRRWTGVAVACGGATLIARRRQRRPVARARRAARARRRGRAGRLLPRPEAAAAPLRQPRADHLGDGARRADGAAVRARAAGGDRLRAGLEALLAVGFLGVGASAIGFVTWAYACARVDVSVAAATLYAVPVVAFSAGWLWLGERPAPLALVGGAIALAGVALVAQGERGRARRRTAAIEEAGPERASTSEARAPHPGGVRRWASIATSTSRAPARGRSRPTLTGNPPRSEPAPQCRR